MSHYILRKNRYWEEYENDPAKRGRKRFIKYHGTTHPDARREQMLATADRKAEEIAAWQRSEFGESGEERAAREQAEAQFSQQAFLEGTRASADVAESREQSGQPSQSNEAAQSSIDDPSSEPSSEPDAGASEG